MVKGYKKWPQRQYTHAAIWAIIAEALLGFGDKATEYFKMINPIEHTKTEEQVIKYKVEPYAIEADIYSEDNLAGRGGWTWYTGSSGWMYTLQVEYILGLRIEHEILRINPCVPQEWNNFEVKFRWKNAVYDIKYERKENVEDKDNEIILDGQNVNEIKLQKSGSYIVIVKF